MGTKIEVASVEAGAKITFDFVNDEVVPTEALAALFAKAVMRLLEEKPWGGMPDIDVALAWSMASICNHAAQLVTVDERKNFKEAICRTLLAYRH